MDTDYDVIVIGAGPAGLAAAVYTSREDLRTAVLEKGVVGGMAALTDEIENYPGFEPKISGLDFSAHLERQAKQFGSELITGREVTGVEVTKPSLVVKTGQGNLSAKAVLVATGSTYRHLGVPGEKEQVGRGVHFCATCDGPIYRGRELIVVGGGNSAMQETLFLARFASKITMLVRGTALKGSAILRREVMALKNVRIEYDVQVKQILAEGGMTRGVEAVKGGQPVTYKAPGIFVLIGLIPTTQPFKGLIDLDEQGFVKTDLMYGTSMLGVFCAGDVRSGSTWQIASAVGEGASAALAIRRYLDELKR
jgi:thioredoxin reductase (NADPH)